jgi:hypothetical protein
MMIGGLALVAAPLALSSFARATAPATGPAGVNLPLFMRATAAMERHANVITQRDRIGIVDFSLLSREPRFHILDMASGQTMTLLVAHGRGSDPEHKGWVEQFSNEPGSHASSHGAYLTGAGYDGAHGASRRLIGLDVGNYNAESRAIVLHPADYVSTDIIERQGKLGRSEGCFAVRQDDIYMALALLGEGRMIYADRG